MDLLWWILKWRGRGNMSQEDTTPLYNPWYVDIVFFTQYKAESVK